MSTPLSITEWTETWAHSRAIGCSRFSEIDSTNTYAKDNLHAVDATSKALLYITDFQKNGRGRGGNTWTSPAPGLTLLSSWSFVLEKPLQPVFAPLAGLALYEAAHTVWPRLKWALKAPNDLYLSEKKVAGLLIENVAIGETTHSVIGLGLNVFGSPSSIAEATSLYQELLVIDTQAEKTFRQDWERFLDAWFAGLQSALTHGLRDELSQADAEKITRALQNLPKSNVLKVDVDMQIHTSEGIRDWHQL